MSSLAELPLHDVNLFSRVASLLDAPAELLLPERLLLYSLVRAQAPRRCLEIGAHFGGSMAIISAALDDLGAGTLVSVDPRPLVPAELWARVAHHTQIVRGCSPAVLPLACQLAGGLFDFIFIDGDHTRSGVIGDVTGALDVAAPGALLLCHDAHHRDVANAISDVLSAPATRLVDCGMLSTHSTLPPPARGDTAPRWGGLRLLRAFASPSDRS